MSNLFSCFACTKKSKQKFNNQNEDKLPKAKKHKKMKLKKHKDGKDDIEVTTPLNNKTLPQPNVYDLKHHKEEHSDDVTADAHPSIVKISNEGAGDAFKSDKARPNDSDFNAEEMNNESELSPVQNMSEGNRESRKSVSEEGSSDAGSCLTDSDLNISEAVFISEEGPRVGSLGASLSRMGLQTVRATMENERRLEKELLNRVSGGSWSKKLNTAPQLRLSLENGKISTEERHF